MMIVATNHWKSFDIMYVVKYSVSNLFVIKTINWKLVDGGEIDLDIFIGLYGSKEENHLNRNLFRLISSKCVQMGPNV